MLGHQQRPNESNSQNLAKDILWSDSLCIHRIMHMAKTLFCFVVVNYQLVLFSFRNKLNDIMKYVNK